jgi:hypothetical protein
MYGIVRANHPTSVFFGLNMELQYGQRIASLLTETSRFSWSAAPQDVHSIEVSYSFSAEYFFGFGMLSASSLSSASEKVQLQRIGKCFKVLIARDEGNIGIDAALRNQCVAQPSLSLTREGPGAKFSSPIPESIH